MRSGTKDSTHIIFVDTETHLQRAKRIIAHSEGKSFFFITNKRQFLQRFEKEEFFYFKNFLELFFLIKSKLNQMEVGVLLAARVDSLYFQLIFCLLRYKEFHSFDEGFFNIKINSRYNQELNFEWVKQKKLKILNKLLGFPIPAAQILLSSKKHYSSLDARFFKQSIIDVNKIVTLEPEKITFKEEGSRSVSGEVAQKRIFIGQPWNFMGYDKKQIIRLFDQIVSLKIQSYLIHPREDLYPSKNFLNDKIDKIKLNITAESFLNNLPNHETLEIYSVVTSTVIDLSKNFNFFLLQPPEDHLDLKEDQDLIAEVMNYQGKKVTYV